MADKIIKVIEPEATGDAVTLKLYAEGSTTVANGSGDTVTESGTGVFSATVTEALSGIYDCVLLDSGGVEINVRGFRESKVWIPGDIAGTYIAGSEAELARYAFNNQVFPPVVRSPTDTNSIRFLFPTANATFTTKTVSIDFGTAANVQGTITYIGALGGQYEYQLAYDADDRPAGEGTARYTFSDGTNTRYITLTSVGAAYAQVASIATEVGKIPRKATAVAAGAAVTKTNTSITPNQTITEVIT